MRAFLVIFTVAYLAGAAAGAVFFLAEQRHAAEALR